jgi:protein-S-isoprenylcysteine O-methyltransferase Ste14
MEYTADQLASFRQSVAKRRQVQTLVVGSLVIAFLLGVLFEKQLGIKSEWLAVLWALAVVAGLILSFVTWRCPACGRYLGRGRVNFCRNCGVALR